VKLIIQTQDANPLIKSGQVARYTGIGNCFTRVYQEQGLKAFWRGNFTNVIRYFPTQAFNFAFKDTIKALFPKYSPKTEFLWFFLTNMASGGLAGAGSLCIVYPLDYARTRLASDVGAGQKSFNGLADCLIKTAKGPSGVMGLYNGFGVSVAGIIPYRGVYFGMFDSLAGINPFRKGLSPSFFSYINILIILNRQRRHRVALKVCYRPSHRNHCRLCLVPLRHHSKTPSDAVREAQGGVALQGNR
jgi:solute carrier family 25 (adenine nucleotide translocator) protein 4/5/6/31